MNIINLIIRYFTDKSFRIYIDSIMAIASNKNGIADKLDEELDEFKRKTGDMLKKRVDKLSDIVGKVRELPGGSMLVSPLNDLLNELKDDYTEIISMD